MNNGLGIIGECLLYSLLYCCIVTKTVVPTILYHFARLGIIKIVKCFWFKSQVEIRKEEGKSEGDLAYFWITLFCCVDFRQSSK